LEATIAVVTLGDTKCVFPSEIGFETVIWYAAVMTAALRHLCRLRGLTLPCVFLFRLGDFFLPGIFLLRISGLLLPGILLFRFAGLFLPCVLLLWFGDLVLSRNFWLLGGFARLRLFLFLTGLGFLLFLPVLLCIHRGSNSEG
jgi:hypothetical protein